MVDITKCVGMNCPIKQSCYRFKAPDSTWQAYSDFNYQESCNYFVPLHNREQNGNLNEGTTRSNH